MRVKVLVADDSEGIRDLWSNYLDYFGFEVRTVKTRDEALEECRTFQPDVLVIDAFAQAGKEIANQMRGQMVVIWTSIMEIAPEGTYHLPKLEERFVPRLAGKIRELLAKRSAG